MKIVGIDGQQKAGAWAGRSEVRLIVSLEGVLRLEFWNTGAQQVSTAPRLRGYQFHFLLISGSDPMVELQSCPVIIL